MSKKPKIASAPRQPHPPKAFFGGRDGLKAYTVEPTAFGPERVISHNDKYVLINDLYPKADVHTLVLPRDPIKNEQHPFDAFEDLDFLAETKAEVEKAKQIVASELRRRYGRLSASEKARREAMDADEIPEKLPEGRDWLSHVNTGIHAHPSMTHLHVHVFSRDMVSECMKGRRHYETFNTPFLVPLDAFPLAQDDPRRHPGRSGYMDRDLLCWRCGKNFSNKFTKLKAHLADEFEEWKKE